MMLPFLRNDRMTRLLLSPLVILILASFPFTTSLSSSSPKHHKHHKVSPTRTTTSTTPSFEIPKNPPLLNRRHLLSHLPAVPLLTITPLFIAQQPANAAKGAAEYDLEYYFRDLVKGNKPEGNLPASQPPPLPPPRLLSSTFASTLLNDECTADGSITIRELARLAAPSSSSSSSDLKDSIIAFREKSKRGFYSRAPWVKETISDEYYFDLTSYAVWRVAAELITNYKKRNDFVRSVGKSVYNHMIQTGLVKGSGTKTNKLTETLPAITQVLNVFNDTQFCAGYRLGTKDDEINKQPLFDVFDDDDFNSKTSVNALVSIFRPATLGASLQITGEGSRFSPDYVGATLAAAWEESLGGEVDVSYESYFVDQEYRPNPKDYFPDEQLLQFTLTKK